MFKKHFNYSYSVIMFHFNCVPQRSAANYPWRSSSHGEWSGLRVRMDLTNTDTRFPDFVKPAGINVRIKNKNKIFIIS